MPRTARRLFADGSAGDTAAREDLDWWESQCRRLADRVIAFVQPVGPWRVTPKRERAEGPSLFSE